MTPPDLLPTVAAVTAPLRQSHSGTCHAFSADSTQGFAAEKAVLRQPQGGGAGAAEAEPDIVSLFLVVSNVAAVAVAASKRLIAWSTFLPSAYKTRAAVASAAQMRHQRASQNAPCLTALPAAAAEHQWYQSPDDLQQLIAVGPAGWRQGVSALQLAAAAAAAAAVAATAYAFCFMCMALVSVFQNQLRNPIVTTCSYSCPRQILQEDPAFAEDDETCGRAGIEQWPPCHDNLLMRSSKVGQQALAPIHRDPAGHRVMQQHS